MKDKDTEMTIASSHRLNVVDYMVGLTMNLVVLGHMSFPFAPDWYNNAIHEWIYRFHMEVFVFLSAFLIRYSFKGVSSWVDYIKYVGRKFKKFFIPFLLVGLVVALSKAWSYGIVKSEIWGYMWESLKCLLLYPMRSEASFLWYIYVLFGFYLVSPLVIKFPSWIKMILCILSMGLPLLGANHFLGGYLFCKYTFFYFLGILCAEGWEQLRDIKTWIIGLLSVPFLLWSFKYMSSCLNPDIEGTFLEIGPQGFDILSGCLALPFLYFVARLIKKVNWISSILTQISKDCFWIYLLQMFVLWACAFGFDYLGNKSFPFWIFMAISTILAISIPIGCSWLSRKTLLIGTKKINKKKTK